MKLFSTLDERKLFSSYADSLDWLLSDGKFDKALWDNKNKVQSFTNAFYKMEHISRSRVQYGPKKDIIFPGRGSYCGQPLYTFCIAKGNALARDLIRHIRNGIAHGSIGLYDLGGELVVELLDFGKEAEQKKGGQTAYMVFPLCFLKDVHELYMRKERTWEGKRSSRKRGQKRK